MVWPKFRSSRSPVSRGSSVTIPAFTSAASATVVTCGPISPRSTESNDRSTCATATDPGFGEISAEPRDGPRRLRAFAGGNAERDRIEPGTLQRAHQARFVARGRGGLADHRDTPGPAEVAEMCADLVEESGAHE